MAIKLGFDGGGCCGGFYGVLSWSEVGGCLWIKL